MTTELEPYGLHLPIFPMFYRPVTEAEAEAVIGRLFDRADKVLLENKCTQAQYEAWCIALHEWESDIELV